MAVYLNKDKTELILTCHCGCGEAARLIINNKDKEYGHYAIWTYMKNNYASEQYGVWQIFILKLKKIWKIICNKDHYYSDIVMKEEEFKQFKEFINKF